MHQLDYQYPESLVATEPRADYRILLGGSSAEPSTPSEPRELKRDELFALFKSGDVLVINDTRVERRRVVASSGLEILFCEQVSNLEWQVLCAARDLRIGDILELPGNLTATLTAKGLPQVVRLSESIGTAYFERYGDLALPPYIQAARGERKSRKEDEQWYQTAWAEQSGSQAAPTASLHFTRDDLQLLQDNGVKVVTLTLHVGIGTFLPLKTENLHEHKMHSEQVMIPQSTLDEVVGAKREGRHVWALGTTVVRSLESWATGKFESVEGTSDVQKNGAFGKTDLFITPGYRFEVVDRLLTNFHQPRSTLLALVDAFAGQNCRLRAYDYAIQNRFRLFSYGDLSVWMKG